MREDLARLETEKQNQNTIDIDLYSTKKVLETINDEDQTVAIAIRKNIDAITALTDAYINTIENGGRVFYVGAGTSGRLGFIDAAELPPTYGIPDGMVEGIMAGGLPAMKKAKEFAEDDLDASINDLKERNLTNKDMVIGLAASGRTPYPLRAIEYAKSIGCVTGSISCVSNAEMSAIADYPVEIVTGQEVVLGSTRMKAGTATKLVLNMISSAVFIRTGRVYKNFLVSGKATTIKGHYRFVRNISQECNVSEEVAEEYLKKADENMKVAMCMIFTKLSKEDSIKLIDEHKGRLREALNAFNENK